MRPGTRLAYRTQPWLPAAAGACLAADGAVGEISDRQIGHQLPVDRRTVRRRIDLKGLDVGEKLRTVSLLLADGRQGLDGGELHVHAHRLILSDHDVMAPLPRRGLNKMLTFQSI